ncbi:MAG: hypothetical protein FWC47_11620 [Oscillospiraceae bacterium]|nr:hypothetical protein [Oscillospiraceae bacterium]
MAVKPIEIQNIIQSDTETFVQSVNDFKASLDECKIKLSDLSDRFDEIEKKLEGSTFKIDNASSYFKCVIDEIDGLANNISLRFENLFDKCIDDMKKTIEFAYVNSIKSCYFKKWYHSFKSVFVWILKILGLILLLQYFLFIKPK